MATTDVEVADKVSEIISNYEGRDQDLIAILQDVQDEYNYLPREALQKISAGLSVPFSRVFSIATFYNAFSLEPKGKYPIAVCTGTACHVKGAPRIVDAFEREIGIKLGETSEDMLFSLEEVRCVGCCGLAPVITIDGELFGKVKVSQVKRLVKKYRDMENK